MNSISCVNSHVTSVMVDQCEALAVATGHTDTVYLVRPTGSQTVNPWVSKQQPCILLPLSYLVLRSNIHELLIYSALGKLSMSVASFGTFRRIHSPCSP